MDIHLYIYVCVILIYTHDSGKNKVLRQNSMGSVVIKLVVSKCYTEL